MNPRATQHLVRHGAIDLDEILDIHGFQLDEALRLDPEFLTDASHEHDDAVSSWVYRSTRPFALDKLEDCLALLIGLFGTQLMRYKGVLDVAGDERRLYFQGVQAMYDGSPGRPWGPVKSAPARWCSSAGTCRGGGCARWWRPVIGVPRRSVDRTRT